MSIISQIKILPPSGEPAIADIGASAGNITYTNTTSGLTATDVQNAIDELSNDYSNLGTAAEKDVPASGDASITEVVMGNDSRLTDARPASDVSSWAKAATKPSYTAAEVGAIPATDKGSNNGVAELDSSGKVPSSQLPSFVDDVIEGYYNTTNGKFYKESTYTTEITGESGKIYLDLSTDTTWRWSGSAFIQIKGDLTLGETSTTAYRGDRGKAAYDHSQATHARTDATKVESSTTNGNIKINGIETTVYTHPGSGTNPHGTTASDIGLGNVGNFKAVSTVASQGLTDTEKTNARTNIGVGNATLTIQKNGTTVKTFTSNATSDVTCDITMTKSDVGLGNVGNFKAVSTVANQGLTDTEKSNARANIGAGNSSLTLGTGSTNAYYGDKGNSAYTHAVTNKGSAFSSGFYKITTNNEGHVTAATAVQKSDITALGIPGAIPTFAFDGSTLVITP